MNAVTPVVDDALLEKALADFAAGNMPAAAEAAGLLMAARPHDRRVLHLAAGVAKSEKRYKDSEQLLEWALAAAATPEERAHTLALLGQLARTLGNLPFAEESSRQAMLLDATRSEYATQFAELLAQRGKLDPAIDVLRSAMRRHGRDPYPCVSLGNIMMRAGRQQDALVFYDMALQRDRNLASAHFNAGVALAMLGKLDAAREATGRAIALDPDIRGYYQLANLGVLKAGDPMLERLESVLERQDVSLETRIDAAFALARVDEEVDIDRSFRFLNLANSMKRGTLDYGIADDEERMDRVSAFFTGDFFERFQGISDSKLAPIFIVGMPRSGTTLVEQMLAAHSQVEAGGELGYMGSIAGELGEAWGARGERSPGTDDEVKADFQKAVAAYSGKTASLHAQRRYFTDKMPANFMFIGAIHIMFPDARIIHCRRDPVDTCLSCYQKAFTSDLSFTYDLTELGQYYKLYAKLMEHWHAVLPPGRILDVDYESVVEEPEQNLRRILSFCGLDYEADCLNFHEVKRPVTTASALQVRRSLYKTSVHRWHKYRQHLGPLLTALGMPADG